MNFTSSVFLTIICLGQTLLAFGQCTFGNRDPGFTEVAPFSHNYVLGVKYNLPADRVINELNLWGLGTMARVQMAIYEDNSGKPAKLLASSVIDSVRTGVVSLSITPLSLKKGDYWIMAVYERSLRSGHTYYKTGVSNSIYYKQHGFGNAIPTDASDFDVYGGQDFQYWASSKTPQGTDVRSACDSFMWLDSIVYTSSNNTAKHALIGATSNGCDSVLTLDLQLTSIDKSVTVAQDELTAQELEASYQWLRCDKGFEPEQGATSKVFTAKINGEYAVELTKDGCIDTTTCFAITEAGKPRMAIDQLKIFPNPSNENFVVSLGEKHRAVNIVITDISGKRIWESTFQNQQEVVISAIKTPGIYFLQINTPEGQKRTFRLVKE